MPPLTYDYDKEIPPLTKVEVKLKEKATWGYVLCQTQKPDFETITISNLTNLKLTNNQYELAKFISYYYNTELAVSLGLFEPSQNFQNFNSTFDKAPNLSQNQQNALNFIKEHKVSLLFGDTGSGKSEIYISLIKDELNKGKQALFLMPEISLTPQMQKRLSAYFGEHLAIWHSKISPKKKSEILANFYQGKIKVIAGARSALFLPFCNLGVIIVDEEHDSSYKNNSNPHYNARDLAIYLSSISDIKVVLGSATPTLTSYKKFPNFRLKGSFFESKKEFIYDISETKITDKIVQEIQISLENQKQVVVFLPTRANFRFIRCKKCFHTIKCPFCSVAMSYHKNKNALKCHYCGFMKFSSNICEICNSDMLEARKIGTSELTLELEKIFPNAKIAKFDRDAITTQKKLETTLLNFNDKKIDILVGTQMLSKGHDYHNVDLAVIMGLDEHFEYCDFRAREKTLALAMQVAGRAGRAGLGRVVLQTLNESFFEEFLQNYDSFLQNELLFRENLYPPFTRLMRILIANKKENIASDATQNLVNEIKSIPEIEIVGYGKSQIELLQSKFRFEILLRSQNHKPLIKAGELARKYKADIDIDPVNFS